MKKKSVKNYKTPKFLLKIAAVAGIATLLGGCETPEIAGDVPAPETVESQVPTREHKGNIEEVVELEGDATLASDPEEIVEPEGDVACPIEPETFVELEGEAPAPVEDEPQETQEYPDLAGATSLASDPEEIVELEGDVACPIDPEESDGQEDCL